MGTRIKGLTSEQNRLLFELIFERIRRLTPEQRQTFLEGVFDRIGRLAPKQREALLEAIEGVAPELVAGILPEVTATVEHSFQIVDKSKHKGALEVTPVEKEKLCLSLHEALGRLRAGQEISKEEAIQALEDAASLIEAFPYEQHKISDTEKRKLVNIATGLSVTMKGKVTKRVFQEGEPARTVYMLRGIKLGLTWDKKLMSVEIDPKELAIRARALSIVGIGSDSATDVSARHDDYFVEAISDR